MLTCGLGFGYKFDGKEEKIVNLFNHNLEILLAEKMAWAALALLASLLSQVSGMEWDYGQHSPTHSLDLLLLIHRSDLCRYQLDC